MAPCRRSIRWQCHDLPRIQISDEGHRTRHVVQLQPEQMVAHEL